MLESVDGRPHLEQARPVIEAGKPLFIDKPIAASLADVIEIYELAARHKVPCFSSSSLRFRKELQGLRGGNDEIGEIVRCDVGGSLSALPGHPAARPRPGRRTKSSKAFGKTGGSARFARAPRCSR